MTFFNITDFGDSERVARKFEATSALARNLKPIMEEVATDMMRVEGILFRSDGRRGGGSWARLKPDTVRKKGDTQILRTEYAKPGYSSIGGNALYRSLTERDAPYQILHITDYTIEFGTDRPWAGVHEHGSAKRKIPRRPLMKFTAADLNRWSGMVSDFITEPFKK
jgi:phage gpG-like protein